MIAYLHDAKLSRERNAAGKNDWDIYIAEILGLIGAKADTISFSEINGDGLKPLRALLIGAYAGASLSVKMRMDIASWVKNGGILIGFAVPGMDDVFGIRQAGSIEQTPDDYAISGYVQLVPHRLTTELHPFSQPDQKLPVFSDIAQFSLDGATELGRLYRENSNRSYTGYPAISWNCHGNGQAGYFGFDLPKTSWLLHQGKPREKLGKTGDVSLIGNNSRTVPYADEFAFLLQNLLAEASIPFLHCIPPDDGKVPDALFYWGGDEYSGPAELSLSSSDWMREQGLPYHINIESDRHPMSVEDFEHIRDNGHEVSNYWHLKNTPGLMEHVKSMDFQLSGAETLKILGPLLKAQSDKLYERFGIRPGSTLFERTMWVGWADLPRLMKDAGATADNTRTGSMASNHENPLDDPFYNGSAYGFNCGTAYPFFYYDDFAHGNARIDFIEQPIVWYELGHRASLRCQFTDRDTGVPEEVHGPIDIAVKYHQVINVFYHPAYICRQIRCKEAIQEVLRYIKERNYHVVHMGNNKCADWWFARDLSSLGGHSMASDAIQFTAKTGWQDGVVVKFPLNGREISGVTGNGKPLNYRLKKEFGRDWLYIVIPHGDTCVAISLKPKGSK
jgi:hypothetical protein